MPQCGPLLVGDFGPSHTPCYRIAAGAVVLLAYGGGILTSSLLRLYPFHSRTLDH